MKWEMIMTKPIRGIQRLPTCNVDIYMLENGERIYEVSTIAGDNKQGVVGPELCRRGSRHWKKKP